MAATITGMSTQPAPQPGFNARRSENGGWIAQHEFAIRAVDFDLIESQFAVGTVLSSLDPSIPFVFSFLRISDVQFSRAEGDLIFISVTATGTNITGDADGVISEQALPTYSLAGTIADFPLTEHPKYEELTTSERVALALVLQGDAIYRENDQTIGNYQESSGQWMPIPNITLGTDAIEFARRFAKGVVNYQRPQITWTASYESTTQISSAQLNAIGKITSVLGPAPTPSGSRNWMLTNATSSQNGELYRITFEWTLSEKGGYDEFIYGND
jgi:hypothetical protein